MDITGATAATLDLGPAGNGDRADAIRVTVVVRDALDPSLPITSSAVTVIDSPPRIRTAIADRTDAQSALVSVAADFIDPDGAALAYSAVALPSGLAIDPSSGVISGTLAADAAGPHDVQVTASDGALTTTDTFSWTVTDTVTTRILASDAFGRTVAGGWGTADLGGVYTRQGTTTDFGVNGSTGSISVAANTNRSMSLAGVSARDIDLTVRLATDRLPIGSSVYAYALPRRVSASVEYRAKLRIAADGSAYVQATAVSANVEVGVGSEVRVVGLTIRPGAMVWLRTQVSGSAPTSIRIRAWADGTPEPATWQVSISDPTAALQASGGVGLRVYASRITNGPVTIRFDDLKATTLGSP